MLLTDSNAGERNSNMADGNRRDNSTTTAPLVLCVWVATGEQIKLRPEHAERAAATGAVVILEENDGR